MASQPAVYTHGHAASVLRSHTWRTAQNSAAYLLPHLTSHPTATVLDIGCGPGTITADFASLVPEGHVTGLDASPDILKQAEAHAHSARNTTFIAGDAHALPFPDASFDVTHAHQVLQHVGDPVQVLKEMRRVTKPGGVVAVRETDYAGMIWFPESEGMTRWGKTYDAVARSNGGEPNAGRRLLAWARQAGFDAEGGKVTCTASCWCYATKEEREWWGGLWAERLVNSNFKTTAVANGNATLEELQELSQVWKEWSKSEDAWFMLPHGEIIAIA